MRDQKTLTAESGNHTEHDARVVSGHTPTPWRLHTSWPDRVCTGEVGPEGFDIADLTNVRRKIGSDVERRANAAFIVRAVNNHDALVAALQLAVDVTDKDIASGLGFLTEDGRKAYDIARAALNSVRESSSTSDPSLCGEPLLNPSVSS